MKINDYALQGYLRSHSVPCVSIVSGDEIVLVAESVALITKKLKKQGMDERQCFSIDAQFELDALRNALYMRSLFSDQKIIDIQVPGKLTAPVKALLVDYAENPLESNVLIIKMPKLTAAELKAKWYKTLENKGLHVPVWPISVEKMPQWVSSCAKKYALSITSEAAAFLAGRCEGNLVACDQILLKFSLLAEKKTLELNDLVDFIEDHAHFDIFALSTAFIKGDKAKYWRILQHLKGKGVEPTLILWSINKVLRQLIKLHTGSARQPLKSLFQQYRIFGPNQEAMRCGLQLISLKRAQELILHAFDIEKSIKGLERGDPWLGFSQFAINTG